MAKLAADVVEGIWLGGVLFVVKHHGSDKSCGQSLRRNATRATKPLVIWLVLNAHLSIYWSLMGKKVIRAGILCICVPPFLNNLVTNAPFYVQ